MKKRIEECLRKIVEDIGVSVDFKITRPEEKNFGDYTTNLPFLLSRFLKKKPIEVAEDISKRIQIPGIDRIEPVKGFINFHLSRETLQENLKEAVASDYGRGNKKGIKINVEFVSANPTGPLHLASARAAAFGDTLVRLFNFMGYEATREYYVNDAGKQVENLARSVEARMKEIKGEEFEFPEDGYLGDYVKRMAEEAVKKGIDDLETLKKFSIDYILSMQRDTLERFRVKFDEFVSEVQVRKSGRIERIFDILKEKGKLFEREGALWYRGERDRVFRKKNGELTYIVPDIAYHMFKFDRGFHHVIDLLGPDHMAHVPDLKMALKDLGYPGDEVEVIIIQWVHLLKEGRILKMSKRAGEFITMDELVEEVGIDPARFFLIMRKASSPLEFDIELAKRQTSENPVYYVQYSHARICSLLDHAEKEGFGDLSPDSLNLLDLPEEISLLREIYHFPEFLEEIAMSREIHLLPRFLMEISGLYHNFYQKNRIVGGEKEKVIPRLVMSAAVRNIVRTGLYLMGVEAPERM